MNITSGKIITAQKVLVYGPEGIGKSTFASQFPNPLFIDTEGSTKHLEVRRLDDPSSWTMLMQEVTYVLTHADVCSTLVIDTADWAEQLCVSHVCAVHHWDGIEDPGYGKGYTYLAEEFGKLLNLLTECVGRGINVVLTAHAQVRKFEQPDEAQPYDRWELKLQRKTASIVKEWSDAVLFANYKTYAVRDEKSKKVTASGGKRVLYTSHHPAWDAKNRWDLPEEIDFEFESIAEHIPATETEPDEKPAEKPVESFKQAPARPTIEVHEIPGHLVPLYELMKVSGVQTDEVVAAVAKKGYFPADTPIENYPPDFVKSALVAAWPKVIAEIEKARAEQLDIPF